MSRWNKQRPIGLVAWTVAALAVAAALALALLFMDPQRLAGRWPLGIAPAEVDAAGRLLAFLNTDSLPAKPERYLIGSPADACLMDDRSPGWSKHWFDAEGFGDSVRIRRLRTAEGGFVVKFRREEPFRAQRHIVLMPVGKDALRAKYLEILADELGVITPEVSYVRLIACGRDQGIHRKEERIDDDFLEKRGLAGASLFAQGHDAARPDHLYPAFEDDSLASAALNGTLELAYADAQEGRSGALPMIVEARTAAAVLLLSWIEAGAAALAQEHLCAYDWSRGRIVPLYRTARGTQAVAEPRVEPAMLDFLTLAARDPAVREAFQAAAQRLEEERWRLRDRFAAMDRAWLPILAEGEHLPLAQARAKAVQEALIGDRLSARRALEALDRELVRHAGAPAFELPVRAARYWPSADDAAILQRIAERTKAFIRGDTLVFPRGRYRIDADLTVPYGRPVVLEQGARLEIGPGRSVVVQGTLTVRGTARNPVFIRAADEAAPYSCFAVLGDGRTRVSISGLQMSGGREGRVNGVLCTGMLAIHGAARTELIGCTISGSQGEDLVNIKGGEVLLRGCIFEDGLADLVDLDRCTGRVEGCRFRSGRKDANGDGLDVSGARILVEDCAFERMMDKGISVGEASQLLVRGSTFTGNRMALAAKDLSIAYVMDNRFLENGIILGAYRKKPIYGGARIVRLPNDYRDNGRDTEQDEHSAVEAAGTLDEQARRIFGMP